jgi:hypothetical protein
MISEFPNTLRGSPKIVGTRVAYSESTELCPASAEAPEVPTLWRYGSCADAWVQAPHPLPLVCLPPIDEVLALLALRC